MQVLLYYISVLVEFICIGFASVLFENYKEEDEEALFYFFLGFVIVALGLQVVNLLLYWEVVATMDGFADLLGFACGILGLFLGRKAAKWVMRM